jgi:type II secretory pathway pseudopilin PulG
MNFSKPKLIMKFRRKDSGRAFSLFELLVVIAVLMLLAAIMLPILTRPRRTSRVGCTNNLKEVGLAFKMWAGDSDDKYPMQLSVTDTNWGVMEFATNGIVFPVFQVMSNELNNPKVVICPADTQRSPATNFTTGFGNTNISYFVGLDADETQPAMFLAGDRNITNGTALRNGILEQTTNRVAGWTHEIHLGVGNILLTDGSVQPVTSLKLNFLLQNSGVVTNRLLMP